MASPLIAGNRHIARRIKYGRCVMLALTDSIFAGLWDHAHRLWAFETPRIGVVSPYSQSVTNVSSFYNAAGAWGANGANSEGGWMVPAFGAIFTGSGTAGAETNVFNLQFQVLEGGATPGTSNTNTYFPLPNQNWYVNRAVTASVLVVNNSTTGAPSFRLRLSDWGATTYDTTTGLAANGTTGTFSTYTINSASRAYTGTYPVIRLLATPNTDYTSKTIRVAAAKIVRTDLASSGAGHMIVNLGVGGTSTSYWSSLTNWTQAARNEFVTFAGIDTVFIVLGQNDGGGSSATMKANYEAIIDSFRAANPNMEFVIVTTHPTSPGSWAEPQSNNEDALYSIVQARSSYCLYLNLFRAIHQGSSTQEAYNYADTVYLSDGIHPSANEGRMWLLTKVWSLIEQACGETRSDLEFPIVGSLVAR
jgi:lysophospholipase L1-like esterase